MRDPGFAPDLFAQDLILQESPVPGLPEALERAGDHPLALTFVLGPGGLDLGPGCACNGLRLLVDNRSGAMILAGVRLVHADGGLSLTANREPVPPGEGHGLCFPRESFGVQGGAGRWDQVRSLVLLFCRPKDAVVPREVRVRVRAVRGLVRRPPAGPRLSAAGLARVLTPGLGRTSGRRDWGPFQPGGPAGAIPPPAGVFFPPDRRGWVLGGTLMGRRVGLPPDWGGGADGSLEWAHFLHRHHFLRPLVRSLGRHPDQGQVLAETLGSWIAAHPVPVGSDGGASPAWETLSVAWRLREWCHLAGGGWERPEFAGAPRTVWLGAIWEHARHLMDHQGHPGNWRLLEAAALALVGLLFQEFREAGAWASTGLERLAVEFERQFFPDGGYWEVSPLYQALCIQAGLEVRETRRCLGRPWPAPLEERLVAACHALAALCRPDFSWPSLNDSGGATGQYRALFRFAGRAIGRADWLWIGTRGRLGTAPAARVRVLPQSGLAAMRTDLGPAAHAVLFRAGPAGANHVHGDCLSLEYCAHGQPLIVDPGIGGYAPGPGTDRARSAAVHTMPLVDGVGPDRASLPFPERTRPAAGFRQGRCGTGHWVCGSYQVGAVRVERLVLFRPDGTTLVRDRFDGEGEHEVAAHWQFMPCRLRLEPALPAAIARVPRTGGAELVLAAVGDGPPPGLTRHAGVVTLGRRERQAPAVRWSRRGGLPQVLLFVISPGGTAALGGLRRWAARLARHFDKFSAGA